MTEAEPKTTGRVPVMGSRLKLFGDGTDGVLVGRRCRDCGEHFFGAPRFCLKCTSAELEPVELSKEGTLHSFTVVRQAPPGWPGTVPYILGSVRLPEGPRIAAEVVDCPEVAVKVGMLVTLTLRVAARDKEGNEVVVYKWRPKTS